MIQRTDFNVAASRKGTPILLTAPEALLKFGSKMLSLPEAYPFFRYKYDNEEKNTAWTKTHVAFSRLPLGDSIQKDEGRLFLVGTCNQITWRFEISEKFISDASDILFIIDEGYVAHKDGKNSYTTLITDTNNLRYGGIPQEGWRHRGLLPNSFATTGDITIYLSIPAVNTAVGIMSIGYTRVGFGPYERLDIDVPGWPSLPREVLVKSNDAK